MDFKRYFGKIKNKNQKPEQKPKIVEEMEQNVEEASPEIVKEVDLGIKKTLKFVDSKKDPNQPNPPWQKAPLGIQNHKSLCQFPVVRNYLISDFLIRHYELPACDFPQIHYKPQPRRLLSQLS